jgi:hypothetical protein
MIFSKRRRFDKSGQVVTAPFLRQQIQLAFRTTQTSSDTAFNNAFAALRKLNSFTTRLGAARRSGDEFEFDLDERILPSDSILKPSTLPTTLTVPASTSSTNGKSPPLPNTRGWSVTHPVTESVILYVLGLWSGVIFCLVFLMRLRRDNSLSSTDTCTEPSTIGFLD